MNEALFPLPLPESSACILNYDRPLQPAIFLRRYKRFFVDVQTVDGQILTVHCANSGSMRSCLDEGAPALILDSGNPLRKLRHSLEALYLSDGWVCLNTSRANKVFFYLMQNRSLMTRELAEKGERCLFPGVSDFLSDFGSGSGEFRSEARFSAGTRFDGVLEGAAQRSWIELKSVSLREGPERVSFPDAVTIRGSKHLEELSTALVQGDRAHQLYVITRGMSCDPMVLFRQFGLAASIDPHYAQRAHSACERGVRFGLLALGMSDRALWVRGYSRWSVPS
jgi:sugar fermentation stimulation protein A